MWIGSQPHIELAHDLGPIQQRCTLAHEMHHLVEGKPCRSLCDDNERKVVEATARWLLPDLSEIGDLLREHDMDETAAQLGVTLEVLIDRLVTLNDVEEAELAPMLPDGSDDAETGAVAHYQPRKSRAAQQHQCRRTTVRSRTPGRARGGPDPDARPNDP